MNSDMDEQEDFNSDQTEAPNLTWLLLGYMYGISLKEPSKKRDWWDKAPIISGFISSIVIALIGILITFSIQKAQLSSSESSAKAQLEAAAIKAQDDKRLQEGQITAQLVEHLSSNDPARRHIAVIALRECVPSIIYDEVLQVLAKTDSSQDVRKAAIEQLGNSKNPLVVETLHSISKDKARPESERRLASQSVRKISIGSGLGESTFVFVASAEGEPAIDNGIDGHGFFTYSLLEGLGGQADLNNDSNVSASELASYLNMQVPIYSRRKMNVVQHPVAFLNGLDTTPIAGSRTGYTQILALIIGISKYDQAGYSLQAPSKDAQSFYDLIQNRSGGSRNKLKMLLNNEATHTNIIQALSQIEQEATSSTLLIIYFSGMGYLGQDGQSKWIVYDSKRELESTFISLDEIKTFLQQSKAETKCLYMDTCFAGAYRESITPSYGIRDR